MWCWLLLNVLLLNSIFHVYQPKDVRRRPSVQDRPLCLSSQNTLPLEKAAAPRWQKYDTCLVSGALVNAKTENRFPKIRTLLP